MPLANPIRLDGVTRGLMVTRGEFFGRAIRGDSFGAFLAGSCTASCGSLAALRTSVGGMRGEIRSRFTPLETWISLRVGGDGGSNDRNTFSAAAF